MDTSQSGPAVSGVIVTTSPMLRLAVAACLARFKGQSRVHTESDLRGYLIWCEDRQLDPFTATRPHIELYLRWLQEVRRFRPSTVSRRMSVLAGFYRTCVIDGVLQHSSAEYVSRPTVPTESPTLGLSHLQFEALLAAARSSANRCDFALVTMLGLLGLRIFEATGSNIEDLGEGHGHRPPCAMTAPARTSTDTPTTSSPRIWPRVPDRPSCRADDRASGGPPAGPTDR